MGPKSNIERSIYPCIRKLALSPFTKVQLIHLKQVKSVELLHSLLHTPTFSLIPKFEQKILEKFFCLQRIRKLQKNCKKFMSITVKFLLKITCFLTNSSMHIFINWWTYARKCVWVHQLMNLCIQNDTKTDPNLKNNQI